MHIMDLTKSDRETASRRPRGRIAAVALAIGGLSASVLVVGTAGAATNHAAKSHAAKSVVVSTVKSKTFGTILVSGKTLYTLKASKTPCASACTKVWPELTLPKGMTKATAGKGVSASKLGTVMRSGGVRQVTYAGKALYWFSGDTARGQVNGNVTDTWGTWSDVATVKPATSGGETTTTTAGTGGVSF
jgi:predicted lipoprotein with Yx(FWY)xxD motif